MTNAKTNAMIDTSSLPTTERCALEMQRELRPNSRTRQFLAQHNLTPRVVTMTECEMIRDGRVVARIMGSTAGHAAWWYVAGGAEAEPRHVYPSGRFSNAVFRVPDVIPPEQQPAAPRRSIDGWAAVVAPNRHMLFRSGVLVATLHRNTGELWHIEVLRSADQSVIGGFGPYDTLQEAQDAAEWRSALET
jgi:hypothetical protein